MFAKHAARHSQNHQIFVVTKESILMCVTMRVLYVIEDLSVLEILRLI